MGRRQHDFGQQAAEQQQQHVGSLHNVHDDRRPHPTFVTTRCLSSRRSPFHRSSGGIRRMLDCRVGELHLLLNGNRREIDHPLYLATSSREWLEAGPRSRVVDRPSLERRLEEPCPQETPHAAETERSARDPCPGMTLKQYLHPFSRRSCWALPRFQHELETISRANVPNTIAGRGGASRKLRWQ
jgi:hypothetical protein